MNKYSAKVDKMRVDRGWSIYKLAKEAGLSESTLNKWFNSDVAPTLPALEQICETFKITLASFFTTGNTIDVTPELKELCDNWQTLTDAEKAAVRSIIKSYQK